MESMKSNHIKLHSEKINNKKNLQLNLINIILDKEITPNIQFDFIQDIVFE